jgi:hypothetical protein
MKLVFLGLASSIVCTSAQACDLTCEKGCFATMNPSMADKNTCAAENCGCKRSDDKFTETRNEWIQGQIGCQENCAGVGSRKRPACQLRCRKNNYFSDNFCDSNSYGQFCFD